MIVSNDDLALTLTFCMVRLNLVTCAFLWGKMKVMYSGIVAIIDVKAGGSMQLNV